MLGIVVVSFGSVDLLERHLAATTQDAPDLHVVVVDNFRSPADQAAVEALCRRRGWAFVGEPTNRGFGAGMNAGAERAIAAGCTELVLLNPDVAVDVAVVRALGEHAATVDGSLVCPRILRPDGSVWFAGAVVDRVAARTRSLRSLPPGTPDAWLTGACLATSTRTWSRLGGFDEDYFLYWEDVDLSVRCTRGGGTLVLREDLTVTHDVGGTQDAGRATKSWAYTYYNCRNRLLFAAKHLSRQEQTRWVVRAPAYAREVVLRGGRRQLARTASPLVAAALGTLAGAWSLLVARASGTR